MNGKSHRSSAAAGAFSRLAQSDKIRGLAAGRDEEEREWETGLGQERHFTLEAGRGGEDEEGEGEEVEKGRAASPNRHGRLAQNRLGAFFPEGRDRAGLLARKRRGLGPSGEWWRPVHSALALHRLCVKVHSHLFIVGAVPGVLSRELFILVPTNENIFNLN